MNCIVIDDEPLARTGMRLLVEKIPGLKLCGSFASPVDADLYLREHPVDLIFLDIQMPTMTGVAYLRSSPPGVPVIITTAYPQFAVEAFELNVVDYLVKPVRFERLYKAVSRIRSGDGGERAAADEFVFIRTERKFVRMHYNEVDYIEGLKDYVIFQCGGERHVVASNLKTVFSALPAKRFIRISKSFIVNSGKITSVENDVVALGKKQLPLGEAYRKDVMLFIERNRLLKRPGGSDRAKA